MFRALVIENDSEWIAKLEEALYSMNFECVISNSESEAIALLRDGGESIGIIFTCIDQERMDGLSVSRRQADFGFNRPVIGLTKDESWASNSSFAEELEQFTDQVVPFAIEQMKLRDVIDNIFWEHSQQSKKAKVRKAKVLIVEDNEVQSGLLSARLIKSDIEPYVAINGVKGLREVHRLQPDLIVMDVNMPVMDGLTLTKLLKESEDTKAIPVFGVSASDSREACIAAGCDRFFEKPYDKKISQEIENFLKSKIKAAS